MNTNIKDDTENMENLITITVFINTQILDKPYEKNQIYVFVNIIIMH